MDILNIISWIKNKRYVTSVDPATTLMPIGLKDDRRDDGYLAGVITVENFAAQITEPVIDAEGNLIVADSSNDTVAVANGASHLIDNFSGMLIVNDHYDGRVETWIAGGGDGVLLGYTNVVAGPCNSTLAMASNGYEWTNVDNMTGPFTFTVVKTRSGN
jgi:hypothetical protein